MFMYVHKIVWKQSKTLFLMSHVLARRYAYDSCFLLWEIHVPSQWRTNLVTLVCALVTPTAVGLLTAFILVYTEHFAKFWTTITGYNPATEHTCTHQGKWWKQATYFKWHLWFHCMYSSHIEIIGCLHFSSIKRQYYLLHITHHSDTWQSIAWGVHTLTSIQYRSLALLGAFRF